MKICTLAAFLLLGLASFAQSRPQSAPAAAPTATRPKIDPAKEADIRRLLDLTGASKIVKETMETMTNGIRPVLANSLPPGEYREKLIDLFFAKFHAKADI